MGRRVYEKKMSIVAAKLAEHGFFPGLPTPVIYRYSEDTVGLCSGYVFTDRVPVRARACVYTRKSFICEIWLDMINPGTAVRGMPMVSSLYEF